jgi:hypothetical protein
MDAPHRVFKLIQLNGDWYWRLDIMRDDGLIGPFSSREEAEKDAKETLGTADGERSWLPRARDALTSRGRQPGLRLDQPVIPGNG